MVCIITLQVEKHESCKSHILHTDIQSYIKNGPETILWFFLWLCLKEVTAEFG